MADSPNINLEFTQVIQTFTNGVTVYPPGVSFGYQVPNNSIPLISHKQTLVRAFLNVNDIWDVNLGPRTWTGQIGVSVEGGGFVRFDSFNGPIPAKKGFQINRGQINDTLNFLIPSQFCKGTVNGIVIIKDNYTPNDSVAQLIKIEFLDVPLVEVHGVFIHYKGVNFDGNPVDKQSTGAELLACLDYVVRAYPINGFAFDGCEVFDWSMAPAPGQTAPDAVEQSWHDLFPKLADLQASSGSDVIYLGLLPEEATCAGTCGLARDGVAALFRAKDTDNAAHEIAHALGRKHTPCFNAADDPDENYPNYWGLPRGTIGEFGVDLKLLAGTPAEQQRALQDPAKVFDFVSYCPPRWMGIYNFMQILEAVQSRGHRYLSLKVENKARAKKEWQYISFRIKQTAKKQELEIRNEFSVIRSNPSTSNESKEMQIEVMDGKKYIIFSNSCSNCNSCGNTAQTFQDFNAWFPVMKNAHSFRIRKKNEIVYEQAISDEIPEIRSFEMREIKRNGMKLLHFSWNAEGGSDTTPLRFTVRFTSNNEKWRSLICGSEEKSLVVSPESLPGGEHCVAELIASSGMRTSSKKIENISLPLKPRNILINSPKNNEQFIEGSMIYFSGVGFSPDFGISSHDEITWWADTKGIIGKGFQLMYNGLSEGEHEIRMTIPDGMGEKISESIKITVIKGRIEHIIPNHEQQLMEIFSREKHIKINDQVSSNIRQTFFLDNRGTTPSGLDSGCGCK